LSVYKNFASQSHHKYKITFFFSGEAKDSVIFSFFILLHKRAKPIHPLYIHPSAHTSTPSLVRRRRRRILLPCFANAKPLPEAGNNYLGSECDHLPGAGNIYISIHSSAHPSAYSFERRQTNTPKAY
jgi:hypothetical protein